MSKNISKYRKQYLKALAAGQVNNEMEYRFGMSGYGRIVWGIIIALSIIAICISVASSGNGPAAW